MINTKQNKELHLAIIWQNARHQETKILDDIQAHFELAATYPITWEQDQFAECLSRFYGAKLPSKTGKAKHCGNGEFLLILFFDHNPRYEIVETSRGSEEVNINIFNSKERFRQWTGGGHKIHATNSIQETNHDLSLLLGINYSDYTKLINENCHKNITILSHVIGLHGWDSLEQLFYIMNACITYVVLRNFEVLPTSYYAHSHGDIDFLVEDLETARILTGAHKVFNEENRVYHTIKVENKEIYVDFRFIDDHYYDPRWSRHILISRILSEKGFYRPTDEAYFYSLIYHALIHKKRIAPDYLGKITNIYKKIAPGDKKEQTFDSYYLLLLKYMESHYYQFVKPLDTTVFFDTQYIDLDSIYGEFEALHLQNIKPFLVDEWKNASGFIYFSGRNRDEIELFIKYGGMNDSVRREYKIANQLHHINPALFPKAYYYQHTEKHNFVAIEKINGVRLDKLDYSALSDAHRRKISEGLITILSILHDNQLVHRDIRPQNILIKDDLTPVLIDFQFVVDLQRKQYREYRDIRRNPKLINGLGAEYAKGIYHWDDAYSMLKVLNHFDIGNSKECVEIKQKISKMIGTNEVIGLKNNIFSKVRTRLLNYIMIYKAHLKVMIYWLLYTLTNKSKYKEKLFKYEKQT